MPWARRWFVRSTSLVGEQRLQPLHLRGVTAGLDLEVLGVNFGQQLAALDLLPGKAEHPGDPPCDLGGDLGVHHVLERSHHLFVDLERAGLHGGGGNQHGARAGRPLGRLGVAAAC